MREIFTEVTGNNKYSIIEENFESYGNSYGFKIVSSNGTAFVSDVTSIKERAYEIAETLIRNNVSFLHLNDVIEDYISFSI